MINNQIRESSASRAWISGLLAWAIPGAGHFLQGRWLRGFALGGSVIAMLVCGLLFGGKLHNVLSSADGVLQQVFGLFNLGTGIIYVVSLFLGVGFSDVGKAQLATFEYGNTFMMVAGLLNYLVMLDAYDLAVGRKS